MAWWLQIEQIQSLSLCIDSEREGITEEGQSTNLIQN